MKEYENTGRAMGTEYSVAIVCDDNLIADHLFHYTEEIIKNYEQKFSRFLLTSELSQLNKSKHAKVSNEFLEVVIECKKLFEMTRGMFNPLVQISRLGYDKTFDEVKNNDSFKNNSLAEDYDIDFSSTLINSETSEVTLQVGQRLDVGGMLKGFIAEKLACFIKNYSSEITGVIVNIGGDLHTCGLDEQGKNFAFTIYNPITKQEETSVELFNESLATSGTYKRKWNLGTGTTKKEIHHVLDSSGIKNLETEIISSSVISESGAKSEAIAKMLLQIPLDEVKNIIPNEIFKSVLINIKGEIIRN